MTCGADGAAEAAYNRIKAVVGAGNIKLAMSDLPSDPLPMFEDGTLLCCTTGIYPLNMYALMMLYNEVTGNPVSETPVYLTQPSLLYTCAEDITELNKYVTNPDFHLWSAEEVKALVKAENPEVSEAFYQEKMNEWSAEWVKSKIGSVFLQMIKFAILVIGFNTSYQRVFISLMVIALIAVNNRQLIADELLQRKRRKASLQAD